MKSRGWYYSMNGLIFEAIAYLDSHLDDTYNWIGPFKTYGAAKQDARDRIKCDLRDLKLGVDNLKNHRKPKGIK